MRFDPFDTEQFAQAMAQATRLGSSDFKEGRPWRTPEGLAGDLFTSHWRRGHQEGLSEAYNAGRYAARACQKLTS